MTPEQERRLRRIAYNRQYYSQYRKKKREQKAAAALYEIDEWINNRSHPEKQTCEIKRTTEQ